MDVHWVLFPISLLIAIVAMSTGIGGAVFFSPLFLIVYGLSPVTALSLSIFIEIFGFASGLFAYIREGLVEYRVAAQSLLVATPAALFGVVALSYIPEVAAKTIFACFLLVLAFRLIVTVYKKNPRMHFHHAFKRWKHGIERYQLPESWNIFRLFSAAGGFLVGLLSSGAGEVNEYVFLKRMRMHGALAAGTSVFIVAVLALFTASLRVLVNGISVDATILSFLIPTVPAVIIGAQIGMRLSQKVDKARIARCVMAGLFVLVAALLLIS